MEIKILKGGVPNISVTPFLLKEGDKKGAQLKMTLMKGGWI